MGTAILMYMRKMLVNHFSNRLGHYTLFDFPNATILNSVRNLQEKFITHKENWKILCKKNYSKIHSKLKKKKSNFSLQS